MHVLWWVIDTPLLVVAPTALCLVVQLWSAAVECHWVFCVCLHQPCSGPKTMLIDVDEEEAKSPVVDSTGDVMQTKFRRKGGDDQCKWYGNDGRLAPDCNKNIWLQRVQIGARTTNSSHTSITMVARKRWLDAEETSNRHWQLRWTTSGSDISSSTQIVNRPAFHFNGRQNMLFSFVFSSFFLRYTISL